MPYGSRSDRRRNLRGAVYGRAVPFYVRRAITSSLSIRVYRYRRYLYSNHGIRRNDMLSRQEKATQDVRLLQAARHGLGRRLLDNIRRDRYIELSVLSSCGDWVILFRGPTKQLDLTWIISMSPAPLCFHTYRLRSAAEYIEPLLRDVTWLSNPVGPVVLETSPREVVLGWPNIEGHCSGPISLNRAQGGAAFQIEVSERHEWQPVRVQNQRSHLSSQPKSNYDAPHSGTITYITLKAVSGVGGVHVVDLRPATWYNMRLRVVYDTDSIATGPPVAVTTRCGLPERPTLRPWIVEQLTRMGTAIKSSSSSFSATARSMANLMELNDPSLNRHFCLRVSWTQPACNGYPIQHYVLQQREKVVDQQRARLISISNDSLAVDISAKWTPWREVYTQLIPGCRIHALARCSASITAAQHTLGFANLSRLTTPTTNHSPRGRHYVPVPQFIAVQFRVAAVNALGISQFSRISSVTKENCPDFFAVPLQWRHRPAELIKKSTIKTPEVSGNAELEALATMLGFPVSLGVFTAASSSVHRPT